MNLLLRYVGHGITISLLVFIMLAFHLSTLARTSEKRVLRGIGVDPAHIRVMVPLKKNFEEMKSIIREEIEYKGVSVLIPRRECIQTLTRKKKASKK